MGILNIHNDRVKPEEPAKADPYAELKEALAAGKTIQNLRCADGYGFFWVDHFWVVHVPPELWRRHPPDCYRVKPEPAAEPQAAPDADGWIEWNGGMPHEYPVCPDWIVQVEMRNGERLEGYAGHFCWQHDGGPGNIMRYREAPAMPGARPTPPAPEATEEPQTVTAQSVLERAASHMAARAATYDPPGGERSMGKAVEAFNAIDRPAEASASDSETGQHAPGVKLDHGKPRAGLVLGGFARALTAVSDVGTFGAKKYTPHGWRSVPHGFDRYTDAMVRHQLAEAVGEQFDAESGLSHAAHAAWNALARLELMLSRRTQLITCALPAEAKAREAAKRA